MYSQLNHIRILLPTSHKIKNKKHSIYVRGFSKFQSSNSIFGLHQVEDIVKGDVI